LWKSLFDSKLRDVDLDEELCVFDSGGAGVFGERQLVLCELFDSE
jgi:hypothetical protein